MRSSFLPKCQPKNLRISALEVYYFKVSTKESVSSCKKNIDSLFVLTWEWTYREFPVSYTGFGFAVCSKLTGQKSLKILVGILEETMTSYIHSEFK